jgi:hypothetical protein
MTKLRTVEDATPEGKPETKEDKVLRARVKTRFKKIKDEYWGLAEDLEAVYADAKYTLWGYSSWTEYIEREHDESERKVQYLLNIVGWFRKLSDENQKWVRAVQWTKAKELARFVTDDNAEEWKRRASDESVRSLIQIAREKVAAEKAAKADPDATGAPADSGSDPEKPHTLRFPVFTEQEKNIMRALEHAKAIAQSDKQGHCLDMICQDYLASNTAVEDANGYLKTVEQYTGFGLIAFEIDPKTKKIGSIVYGGDLAALLESQVEDQPAQAKG